MLQDIEHEARATLRRITAEHGSGGTSDKIHMQQRPEPRERPLSVSHAALKQELMHRTGKHAARLRGLEQPPRNGGIGGEGFLDKAMRARFDARSHEFRMRVRRRAYVHGQRTQTERVGKLPKDSSTVPLSK